MENESNTVQVKTSVRKTRRLKMAYNISQTDQSRVAAIRVSGLYLQDLGFSPDGYFDMTINTDGTLTLKPVSKEQHEADLEAIQQVRNSA